MVSRHIYDEVIRCAASGTDAERGRLVGSLTRIARHHWTMFDDAPAQQASTILRLCDYCTSLVSDATNRTMWRSPYLDQISRLSIAAAARFAAQPHSDPDKQCATFVWKNIKPMKEVVLVSARLLMARDKFFTPAVSKAMVKLIYHHFHHDWRAPPPPTRNHARHQCLLSTLLLTYRMATELHKQKLGSCPFAELSRSTIVCILRSLSTIGSETLAFPARPAGRLTVLLKDFAHNHGAPLLSSIRTTADFRTVASALSVTPWNGESVTFALCGTFLLNHPSVQHKRERSLCVLRCVSEVVCVLYPIDAEFVVFHYGRVLQEAAAACMEGCSCPQLNNVSSIHREEDCLLFGQGGTHLRHAASSITALFAVAEIPTEWRSWLKRGLVGIIKTMMKLHWRPTTTPDLITLRAISSTSIRAAHSLTELFRRVDFSRLLKSLNETEALKPCFGLARNCIIKCATYLRRSPDHAYWEVAEGVLAETFSRCVLDGGKSEEEIDAYLQSLFPSGYTFTRCIIQLVRFFVTVQIVRARLDSSPFSRRIVTFIKEQRRYCLMPNAW